MASTSVTVDRNWTLISTGPQDATSVQPERKRCQVFVSASTPAASEFGVTVNPEEMINALLEIGENLYGRSMGGNVNLTVTE
ncbi:MAG: hypothetical protein GY746_00140 [Gammaproteobacteria bacterium]|nr:hypothetical protein [Gammaproteobacteria bacterium]MCP4488157.1 hypothetical protein [Gammaproteobacteria bacterium]